MHFALFVSYAIFWWIHSHSFSIYTHHHALLRLFYVRRPYDWYKFLFLYIFLSQYLHGYGYFSFDSLSNGCDAFFCILCTMVLGGASFNASKFHSGSCSNPAEISDNDSNE
eukprot:924921_1